VDRLCPYRESPYCFGVNRLFELKHEGLRGVRYFERKLPSRDRSSRAASATEGLAHARISNPLILCREWIESSVTRNVRGANGRLFGNWQARRNELARNTTARQMMMRIAHEILSVFLDSRHQEITLLLAGLRVAMTPTEAAGLVGALLSALEQLKTDDANSSDEEGKMIQIGRLLEGGWEEPDGRNIPHSNGRLSASIEEDNQDQNHEERRALITAKIKDKGLSLREGRP
jgi:hypothetical protein